MATTNEGRFIQLIEVSTDRFADLEALHEQWREETEGERTVLQEWICRDRDRPDTYVIMVEFPSHEAAQVNNDLPATGRIAEGMAELATGAPTFRNLDLVRHD
jgi:quinol monooxygenase YgiN